jgi:hypothetical protein
MHKAKLDSLIDAHGLKIQGKGYGMFLPKFLGGGGSRVSGKIARVGLPILRFIAFLLTSFSKICLGGCCFIPPSPPYPPCVHLWTHSTSQCSCLRSRRDRSTPDRTQCKCQRKDQDRKHATA